jgi:long-chain acyl-CoA synthetase
MVERRGSKDGYGQTHSASLLHASRRFLMVNSKLFIHLFPGVQQFDKIAIISNNRWEWATIAAAAYSLNASLVPMYEAQLPSDWTYILNDSGSCAVFCATQEIFDQVQKEVLPSTPTVKASLCLDAPLGEPHSFKTVMAASAGDTEGSLIRAPTKEDLANLIYTSVRIPKLRNPVTVI